MSFHIWKSLGTVVFSLLLVVVFFDTKSPHVAQAILKPMNLPSAGYPCLCQPDIFLNYPFFKKNIKSYYLVQAGLELIILPSSPVWPQTQTPPLTSLMVPSTYPHSFLPPIRGSICFVFSVDICLASWEMSNKWVWQYRLYAWRACQIWTSRFQD